MELTGLQEGALPGAPPRLALVPVGGPTVSDCHPQMVSKKGSSPWLVLRKDSC